MKYVTLVTPETLCIDNYKTKLKVSFNHDYRSLLDPLHFHAYSFEYSGGVSIRAWIVTKTKTKDQRTENPDQPENKKTKGQKARRSRLPDFQPGVSWERQEGVVLGHWSNSRLVRMTKNHGYQDLRTLSLQLMILVGSELVLRHVQII